jgi:hypothetical protein
VSLLSIEKCRASRIDMNIPLIDDEIAYLCGQTGTVALVKTLGHFFYMDTDSEEIVIFTDDDDLLIASSFGTGEKVRRGLKCMLYLIRDMNSPLIVLPKGHPASPRLTMVVSIGSKTRISCNIEPGTHPEQDVLCGSKEFDGLEVFSSPEGAILHNFAGDVVIEKI